MRVDAERTDHVNQRVGVDVFLLRMATQHELELWGCDRFTDDMENVVAHDAFGSGKITDTHLDDPAIHIGDRSAGVAPMLAILLHRHILWLPVVRLHFFVEVVGPGVFQGQNVEEHRLASIDDALGGECGFGLIAIQYELAVSECDGCRGHL